MWIKKLELLSEKNKLDSSEKMEYKKMIEKIKNNTEEMQIQTTNLVSPTEKIIQNTEKINENSEIVKKYRGNRGPDKNPRRINENSIQNLKPFSSYFRKNPE